MKLKKSKVLRMKKSEFYPKFVIMLLALSGCISQRPEFTPRPVTQVKDAKPNPATTVKKAAVDRMEDHMHGHGHEPLGKAEFKRTEEGRFKRETFVYEVTDKIKIEPIP